MKLRFLIPVLLLALCAFGEINGERGVMVREAQIYLSPDAGAQKLGVVERGHEVVVIERSREWIDVMAVVRDPSDMDPGQKLTGWILDKGVVRANTPNGDKILFGEAVDSESEASRRGGRKGADADAMRLYLRTAEYFPKSPLAGEAAYRAADDQWQMDRIDVMTRRSARERDPRNRPEIEERYMRDVMHKFPGTKWADMAAFHLIDNKLCGDWEGLAKCPEKEAEIYQKYVNDHPQSPNAPEALYQAARRYAALMQIYPSDNKANKVPEAKQRAQALAQRVVTQYPQSDWASRAQTLLYMMEQNIPQYGNSLE